MAKVAPAPSDTGTSNTPTNSKKLTVPAREDGRNSVGSCASKITHNSAASSKGRSSGSSFSTTKEAVKKSWYESTEVAKLRKVVTGKWMSCVMLVALFLALFLGELFVLLQVPSNTEQNVILTIVIFMFLAEIVALAATDSSYLLGVFFWMDFIGTMSMIFDVSYLQGEDATEPHVREFMGGSSATDTENVIVVRTTRAAKLGARAGRLSRVLKILRFLMPLLGVETQEEQARHGGRVKMAKVISSQLTNVLSTRVAFLTICIVVIIPVFSIFLYPVFDDSMVSWTLMLNENAVQYVDSKRSYEAGAIDQAEFDLVVETFMAELRRFARFYEQYNYGPYSACLGEFVQDEFVCKPDVLDINFGDYATFSKPDRQASVWLMSYSHFQAAFTLESPKREESALNLGLLVFIISIMCAFGLVISNNISVIALQPLERMLTVVRDKCTQIFKYTDELQDGADDGTGDDDVLQDSEFVLLEKAVQKLAGIVDIATSSKEPQLSANMTADDLMALSWMQGDQVRNLASGETASAEGVVLQSLTGTGSDIISMARAALPESLRSELETENWDSCSIKDNDGAQIAMYILCCYEPSASWIMSNLGESQVAKFVSVCESKYPPNPFHNFAHGLDCMFTVSRYMKLIEAQNFLSEQQMFFLLVAAIGHDLGHPGLNNQYLIETAHELAVRYNDRAPLENMHCSTLFQIMSDPEANVFSKVSKENFKEIRKGIIACILHTDMAQHFAMVKELMILYEMNSDAFDNFHPGEVVKSSPNSVQMVLNALLHTADVNNPMKPWKLAHKLALKCVEEFFAQGDLEKKADIPVQMLNDRDKVSTPNAQIGFIEYLVVPLAEGVVKIFPQLESLAIHLGSNIGKWADMWIDETSPTSEAKAKVQARVQKVSARCDSVTLAARGLIINLKN